MNTPYIPNLLRRTAVAFAAVAGFMISVPAVAQTTNLLKRSTGETICSYTGLSVAPNGNVVVSCDAGGVVTPPPPPPPPAGQSFGIASAPSTLAPREWGSVMVNRVGGTAGVATVNYTVSGGCTPVSGALEFGDGYTGPAGFGIQAPTAGGGSCTATITSTNLGSVGSPSSATISISGGTSAPVAGCPAVPTDVLDFDLKLSGADRLIMSSGRIASAVLPGVRANGGTSSSGQILFGESTIAPRAARIEISVSKCRGVIDTNGGTCYLNSSNPTFTKMEWIERAIWGASTASVAQIYNLCQAFAEPAYYVNIRYSYSASDCQYGQCGFVSQWNYGSYN